MRSERGLTPPRAAALLTLALLGPRVYWTTLETAGDLVFVATEAGSGRRLWRRTVRRPDPRPRSPIP